MPLTEVDANNIKPTNIKLMKLIFIFRGVLFGLLILSSSLRAASIDITPISATYSVGQTVSITLTGSPNTSYTLTALENATSTTPMTAIRVRGSQIVTFGENETTTSLLVEFLPGSEGEGRVFLLVGSNDDREISGVKTIIPAPFISLSPSGAIYSEGQRITLTMTGGLAGLSYIIKMFDQPSIYEAIDLSGNIIPTTSQGTINIIKWQEGMISAEFYIQFSQGSKGSNRYLIVHALDYSHLAFSPSFNICPGSTLALANDVLVPASLGPNNCSVLVNTQAQGNSFVFTGPDGYVFSNVFRNAGTYPVSAPITKPGTYQLTVSYDDYCGKSTATKSFTVTGEACK